VIALLDVSVLLPLFDATHQHHELAHDWFEDHRRHGWATCPITENGFVRLVTRPSFVNPPHRAVDVVPRLTALRKSGDHKFWPASLSLTDEGVFNLELIQGHKQLTDVYLLGLATANGGAFATFDRSVHLRAVKSATTANLIVISAAPEASRSGDR
jgi:toxin-antitoxin system PIN domain toxin